MVFLQLGKLMSATVQFINITNGVDIAAPARLGGNIIIPGSTVVRSNGDVILNVGSAGSAKPFGAFTLDSSELGNILFAGGSTSVLLVDEDIPGFTPTGPRIEAVGGNFNIEAAGYYSLDLEVVADAALVPMPNYQVTLSSNGDPLQVTNPGIVITTPLGSVTRFQTTGLVYLPLGTYTVDALSDGYTGSNLPNVITGTLRIAAQAL